MKHLILFISLSLTMFSCETLSIAPDCPAPGMGEPLYQLLYTAIDTTGINTEEVYSYVILNTHDANKGSKPSPRTIALSRKNGENVFHYQLDYSDQKWRTGEIITLHYMVNGPNRPGDIRLFMGNGSEDINYFHTISSNEWVQSLEREGEHNEHTRWSIEYTIQICKEI